MSSLLRAYGWGVRALGPLLPLYLRHRVRRGKEDPARLPERFGHASQPRPAGPVLWIHGASVGESLSVLPLLEKLLNHWPEAHAIVTTGTFTSAKLMAARLPARAVHQLVPLDHPACVARFLDHWKPNGVLWLESDLWPTILQAFHMQNMPAVLVNGRMSDRSRRGWAKRPAAIATLLQSFALVLARSAEDAARFRSLGAPDVRCHGDLKQAAPPLPVEEAALASLRRQLGDRPRWLLASSHPGEDVLAGSMHQALRAQHPGLLTMIAPRHPERGADIADALRATGLTAARRSLGEPPAPDTDVYLLDTMGEMGLAYRLSPITVMGKTLASTEGQNPLEPARLGCAVLAGATLDNFRDLAAAMTASGALTRSKDLDALQANLDHLLRAPEEVARRGAAAQVFAQQRTHILDAVAADVTALLGSAMETKP